MRELTLEMIQRDSMWVVKYNSKPRICCRYSQINRNDGDIRDIDLAARQPQHLQTFFDAMWKYENKNGWITIPDYYKIWVEEGE